MLPADQKPSERPSRASLSEPPQLILESPPAVLSEAKDRGRPGPPSPQLLPTKSYPYSPLSYAYSGSYYLARYSKLRPSLLGS